MILSCQSISKSFGTDEILKDVSFHIEENEKDQNLNLWSPEKEIFP